MNQNERVARLLGWVGSHAPRYLENGERVYQTTPLYPAYDTDANATRDLLEYVKARGREHEFAATMLDYANMMLNLRRCQSEAFALMSAPPQQIYAAFCATFAKELEAIQ